MRLLALRLRNFKGVRQFELQPDGWDVTVFGDNGTGKTTLFDSFTWLLFGKDSQNRADFEVKTLGSDGKPIHNLEHEVEAELEFEGGRRVVLRKVFKEKWTRKRGSAVAEFTGHTVDHYIDGVPTKQSDYSEFINRIASEKVFRLLTDPLYFNTALHWQDRRRILLEACGDVSDQDVIAADSHLAPLPDILKGRSVDDHRKVVMARRAEINRELDRIPVRIDEVRRNIPAVPNKDRNSLLTERDRLRAAIQAKEQEKARIEAGGELAELQRRLAEIETALLQAQQAARAGIAEQLSVLQERRLALMQEKVEKESLRARYEREAAEAEQEALRLAQEGQRLRQRWYEVNAQEFTEAPPADVADTCATCGQPLPQERVEEALRKAQAAYEERLAQFNANKAAALEQITAEGKATAQRQREAEARRDAARAQAEAMQAEIAEVTTRLEALNSEIGAVYSQTVPETAELARLKAEKAELEAAISRLREDKVAALQAIDQELQGLESQLYFLDVQLSAFERREQAEARIAELEAEEKRLAAEFEELERQLHLLDLFVQTKVRMLDERINSRFRIARFRLFETQINGGIAETCECMVNGVPYNSLNHGARIQAGLDIIQTLGDHYGFRPPIFVDNAESVTDIPQTTAQQIRLVVSAGDRTLRVVTHEPVKEAV